MKKIMRIVKFLIKLILFRIVNLAMTLFCGTDESKVFFISDAHSDIGGNFKYVYDCLQEKGYACAAFCKNKNADKINGKDFLYIAKNLSTAKYIFLEDIIDYVGFMRRRKGQKIIQLWHGAGAYKRFGFSRLKNETGKLRISNGHKKYTNAIVSADSIRGCYAEAFGISEDKIRATGIPRTDAFFDTSYIEKKKEELYERFPAFRNKKIILFAPTYRGTKIREASYDFSRLDAEKLYQELKDEYVFVFKLHPAVYNHINQGMNCTYDQFKHDDFYFDLSAEREVNDLLLIADILVTDYSSVIFDYVLLDKPVVYYAYDLDEYYNDRSFYYSFDTYVYGEIVHESAELIDAIKTGSLMQGKRQEFMRKFMSACDGNSTEKVYEWIFCEDGINTLQNN